MLYAGPIVFVGYVFCHVFVPFLTLHLSYCVAESVLLKLNFDFMCVRLFVCILTSLPTCVVDRSVIRISACHAFIKLRHQNTPKSKIQSK